MNFYILRNVTMGAVMALFITGCSQSYVDPSYGKVAYENLNRRDVPAQWQITVEFQRNGVAFPRVDELLRENVERVVRASGVAVPAVDAAAPELRVVVNNIADINKAMAKGFGTGLTLGLAGSLVTDYYEMEIVLTDGGKVFRKSGYKHAIHTAVGNSSGPTGVVASASLSEAFNTVVEELMLNALKDIENEYNTISLHMLESEPCAA
jgi:hypothetical protein